MATVTATATVKPTFPRWAMVTVYLAVLVVAEVLVAFGGTGRPWFYEYGLTVHILLVVFLLVHSTLVASRDPVFSTLLVALSLASISRISNLAIPSGVAPAGFPILVKLALVSVPLLISIAAVAYVQRLPPRSLWIGLGLFPEREIPRDIGVALTGIPLGFVEWLILRPPADWLGDSWTLSAFLGGVVVIFLVSGLAEELIFRGILLKRAVEGFGTRNGILFVTGVFTTLHIFFRNPLDLAFVFFVGLFYAAVVLRTRSLWGVIGSHTLANVILYIVAPYALL